MASDALQALYAGNVDEAKRLLPPDSELSVFDAAAFGRIDRLRTILEEDASRANALSSDGFTPLHLACYAEQEGAARVLIEHGADVNVRSTGSALLSSGGIDRPHCQATTVTFIGNFARGGIGVSFSVSALTSSAGPSRT